MTSPWPAPPGNALLAHLPDADRARLAPHLDRVALAAGQVVAHPGDTVREVLFLERPVMVGLYVDMPGGRVAKTAGLGSSGAVGLLEAVSGGHALTRASVVMAGPALRLSAAVLRDLLPHSRALRRVAARHTEALIAQIMQNAACNAVHTVEKRVARWLLAAQELAEAGADGNSDTDAGGPLELPLTQEMLADTVGAQRTTVTVIAARLKAIGAISHRRGRICITDIAALEALACDCNLAVSAQQRRLFGAEEE